MLRFHPRALWHALLTYPRFLGRIKPALLAGNELESLCRWRAMEKRWESAVLKAPVGRRLLVIAPHPDDESIGPGGLLLAHRGLSEIHILNVFSGDGGGALEGRPWEDSDAYRALLVAERRRELLSVADVLGVKSIEHLELSDSLSATTEADARRMRACIDRVRPDVILIPWYLDNQPNHRATNVLFAAAATGLDAVVLGFEIWTLAQVNALFDITDFIDEKVALVHRYPTQNTGIDYAGYVRGLAATRAFQGGLRSDRGGAAEGFMALPARDYCDLVRALHGTPGQPGAAARTPAL